MILNALRDIFPRSGWKSFLKGRAKSTAESLLMMPNTLAMGFKPWLPLRGSWCCPSSGATRRLPPVGEGLSGGDTVPGRPVKFPGVSALPLGELARERLRGRGKTLTALPERAKKSGSEAPTGVSDPQIERYFCFTAGRRYRSRCGWRWRYPQPCRRHRQWNTPGCRQLPAQQRQIRWSVRP